MSKTVAEALTALDAANIDSRVMGRLKAPFDCEFIKSKEISLDGRPNRGRWRIHDANDDAIASVSGLEEGYARLIVLALNEHFLKRSGAARRK